MSMTRKDYVMIAETIKELADNPLWYEFAPIIAGKLAARIYADNKAFDRNRFLKDCGVI